MEIKGMRSVGGLYELTEDLSSSPLYNEDLAPTTLASRTWSKWNLAALWVGMSVCIPTYMLAAGLISSGMTWWQAVLTVFLGNLLVLIPMVLNAHAGTKYGIPFPVFLRASFGTRGSNIPAMLRAFVACGWFGIQTWIGGAAIYVMLTAGGFAFAQDWSQAAKLGFIGINQWQLLCFFLFWALNIGVILAGIESIKWLETFSAPLLLLIGLALLGWGVTEGGGLGHVLGKSSQFSSSSFSVSAKSPTEAAFKISAVTNDDGTVRATQMQLVRVGPDQTAQAAIAAATWKPFLSEGLLPLSTPLKAGEKVSFAMRLRAGKAESKMLQASATHQPGEPPAKSGDEGNFWLLFIPALTAMVAFWATLSLNIADFTRFARTQKDQFHGQLLGLPSTMALYTFIGVTVTCASLVIFKDILIVEDAPWDPVALLARFQDPWVVIGSMLALAIATLSTNIAANVVSPANDFSNLAPSLISFRTGGLITGVIGILIMPWKLIETSGGYIFTWLIGYGGLLGPIGGIMIADYYVVRRMQLAVPELYKPYGSFRYESGVSWLTVNVLILSILPNIPGFLVAAGFMAREKWADFLGSGLTDLLMTGYNYSFFVGFGIAFVLYTIVGFATGRDHPL